MKPLILIAISLVIITIAPFFKLGNERVQPQPLPNPIPMSYVEIAKRYHGTLVATFRHHRWYFERDGEWCKLFKWPEGV
jgi:hypothetical protein